MTSGVKRGDRHLGLGDDRHVDAAGSVSAIMDLAPSGEGAYGACPHEWEFFGSLGSPVSNGHRSARALGGCEHPTRLRCLSCPRMELVRCKATRDDKCAPCAERHRNDIARVMRSGFNGDRPEGFFFVTLTAPGEDVLPWDTEVCGHAAGECSGVNGCRCDRYDVGAWNASAPQRWSWFVTELRRSPKADVQFCGSWETQSRGALHRHFLMWTPGATTRRVRAAVRLAAYRWDFGRQMDVQSIAGSDARELARKAGYCAKYATKGGDLAVSLDVATGKVREGAYRRWSASRRWGTTMRCVREERAEFARRAAGGQEAAGEDAQRSPAPQAPLDLEREIYAKRAEATSAKEGPSE